MKKNLLLIVLLMILIPLAGYSQNETKTQFTVAGVIVDASGERFGAGERDTGMAVERHLR